MKEVTVYMGSGKNGSDPKKAYVPLADGHFLEIGYRDELDCADTAKLVERIYRRRAAHHFNQMHGIGMTVH